MYKPRMAINFDSRNRFHLYHCEGGDAVAKRYARLNIIVLLGNAVLLFLEVISPFFGFWHGLSLSLGMGLSLMYGAFLQYFTSRMAHNVYLLADGKHIEIEKLNAFWVPKTETYRIVDLGNLTDARLYNVQVCYFQQREKIYINLSRNIYKNVEFNEMLKKILSGVEISFSKQGAQKKAAKSFIP